MNRAPIWIVLLACAGCHYSLELQPDPAPAEPQPIELERSRQPETWQRTEVETTTPLALPFGQRAGLAGEWTRRDTLWEDAGVLLSRSGELCVLEGGGTRPRRLWKNPEPRGSLFQDAAWSPGGDRLFLWLSLETQLCSIDTQTGTIDELLELDRHVTLWNPWHFLRHLDPLPEARPQGLVVDADSNRLLVLLNEESNGQVAFWQRRMDRGGAWLAAVDSSTGRVCPLFEKSRLPHGVRSWDLSLESGRLYVITRATEAGGSVTQRRRIEERRLDGELLRVFDEPSGKATSLQLSPDGRRLLIAREYKPDVIRPSGELKELSRDELKELVAAQDGGFLVLELETAAVIDGPASGSEPRWAPDGDRIVYVDGWDVNVCSLKDGSITTLIAGGPEDEDWYVGTWVDPTWSPDGRRLSIRGRALGRTLLLDLSEREYLVLEKLSVKSWAPSPHPFDELPLRVGR